ncbi:MAG: protein-L-isoaspartate O-methyltransferase family protein, partial [Microvirga sp.]
MVDFAQARRMMVDSQLRTFDVNDVPLLDAMETIPRERFVLPGRVGLAYIDQDIPVSEGAERRFMLAPMVLARMIQSLEISPGMKALDVAGGLGYSSAVLAELGA